MSLKFVDMMSCQNDRKSPAYLMNLKWNVGENEFGKFT
jgi:hypothetical protein